MLKIGDCWNQTGVLWFWKHQLCHNVEFCKHYLQPIQILQIILEVLLFIFYCKLRTQNQQRFEFYGFCKTHFCWLDSLMKEGNIDRERELKMPRFVVRRGKGKKCFSINLKVNEWLLPQLQIQFVWTRGWGGLHHAKAWSSAPWLKLMHRDHILHIINKWNFLIIVFLSSLKVEAMFRSDKVAFKLGQITLCKMVAC